MQQQQPIKLFGWSYSCWVSERCASLLWSGKATHTQVALDDMPAFSARQRWAWGYEFVCRWCVVLHCCRLPL